MTTTTSLRRSAAFLAVTGLALTTAAVGSPATAHEEQPTRDRPCFIVQPRWNTALDGPAPTCAIPTSSREAEWEWGTPGSSAGRAPRRTGRVQDGPADVATLADCLDPGRRPPVRTCPYPIKSGDQFSDYLTGTSYDDSSGAGGL